MAKENCEKEELEKLLEKANAIRKEHPEWSLSKCVLEVAKLEEEPEAEEPEEEAEEAEAEEPAKEEAEEVEPVPEPVPEAEPELAPEPEVAKDLGDYTEDELKEELKRRETPEKKELAEKKKEMETLEEKNRRLAEELAVIKDRGIKITRQPQELAEKTGSKTKYMELKDGSIYSWDYVKKVK